MRRTDSMVRTWLDQSGIHAPRVGVSTNPAIGRLDCLSFMTNAATKPPEEKHDGR